MNLFRKKKNRVIILSLATGAVISASTGAFVYSSNSDSNLSKLLFNNSRDAELASNKNNISKSTDSIKDNNVIENTKPIAPKPVEEKVINVLDTTTENSSAPEVNRNTVTPERSEPLIAKPNVVTKQISIQWCHS